MTPTTYGPHDDLRVHFLQSVKVDTEAFHNPRSVILKDDVCMGNKLKENVSTVFRVQINRNAFFPGVVLGEVWRQSIDSGH
tara:strand:- start:750 stop:992 length:243 start_codon:yes stop_codon:yes gene_type:complete